MTAFDLAVGFAPSLLIAILAWRDYRAGRAFMRDHHRWKREVSDDVRYDAMSILYGA